MFEFILGKAKKLPGSSVLYYQARDKGLWAALEAWKQGSKHPRLFPHQIWSFLEQKSLNFSLLLQYSQTKGFVPDLTGLIERVLVFPLAVLFSTIL